MMLAELGQERDPVAVGQVKVGDHDLHRATGQNSAGRLDAVGYDDTTIYTPPNRILDQLDQLRLVIHYEHARALSDLRL